MHEHWSYIIEPICKQLAPKNIVEIGTRKGSITKTLLSYCDDNDANLHTIDPVGIIEKKLPRHHVYHDHSLNVLENISSIDMVCIYGENWYTVYHELLLIHKHCQSDNDFPFVCIHGVGQPFGRRDHYTNIDWIPETFRQATGNIMRDKKCVSLYENTLRNGVKTAVEDFLRNAPLCITYQEVPGFNGLGILMTENHTHRLSSLLDDITLSPTLHTHTEALENERGTASTLCLQHSKDLNELRTTHSHIQDEYLTLRERHGQLSNDYSKSQQQSDHYHVVLQSLKEEAESAKKALGILRAEQSTLQAKITSVAAENTQLETSIHSLSKENTQLQTSLAEAEQITNHFTQTISWRCTRILRYIGYLLKKIRT